MPCNVKGENLIKTSNKCRFSGFLLAAAMLIGMLPLTVVPTRAADVNGEGKVSATDALLILQYAAVKPDGFSA